MPEGTVDVIPVDLVVAAIIARRRTGPSPRRPPGDHQVASGRRNPLQLPAARRPRAGLVHRAPALRRRGPADRRARVVVPRPRPGAGASSSGPKIVLDKAETVLQRAARCAASRPSWRAKLEEQARARSSGPSSYVELYGAYAECEAIYGVDRLLALLRRARRRATGRRSLRPARHRLGPLRQRRSTCRRSSSTPGSAPTPGEARTASTATTGCAARSSSPDRHLAAFDLENTLIASNVVASLLVARHPPPAPRRARCASSPRTLAEAPRCSRSTAATAATSCATSTAATRTPRSTQLDERRGRACSATSSSPSRSRPRIRRVREHRALGHRTVLITGALDFVVEPLRAAVRRHRLRRACRRRRRRRHATPASSPTCRPTGESRAQALLDYADAEGLRPRASRSPTPTRASDLPMLEAVGFPVAVNPETRLAALARKRGWLVEHWSQGAAAPSAARARSAHGERC